MAQKRLSPEIQAIISSVDAGYFATTVKLVRQLLENGEPSQRALLDLGFALMQLSRFDEAEEALRAAIDLAPDEPNDVIYGQLGNLYKLRGNFEKATEFYKKQIAADTNDSAGYVFLANLLVRKGEVTEAIELLESAKACTEGCPEEVHIALGMAYRTLGQYSDAKREFECVLEIEPNNTIAQKSSKDVDGILKMESRS